MEENQIIYSLITFGVFVLLLVVAILLLFLNFGKNKRRLLAEQENLKAQFAQTLLQTQLEIQEQVFTQISQEIHDNIGQVLSLVRLNINTLGQNGNAAKIQTTDELLGKAIQDLRNLSHTLNTNYIKEVGLVEAIHQLLSSLQRTGQFKTFFQSAAETYDLADEKAIILFRIVQEVVNNIMRHAEATEISVSILGEENLACIVVYDNGRGFDTAQLVSKKGMGLANMKTRAELVGALVQVFSEPGEGTRIEIANQLSQ